MYIGNGWISDDSDVESPRVKELRSYLNVLSEEAERRREFRQHSIELKEDTGLNQQSDEDEAMEEMGDEIEKPIEEWEDSLFGDRDASESSVTVTEASEISLRSIDKAADLSETEEQHFDQGTPEIDTENPMEMPSSTENTPYDADPSESWATLMSIMETMLKDIFAEDRDDIDPATTEEEKASVLSIEHRRMHLVSHPVDVTDDHSSDDPIDAHWD